MPRFGNRIILTDPSPQLRSQSQDHRTAPHLTPPHGRRLAFGRQTEKPERHRHHHPAQFGQGQAQLSLGARPPKPGLRSGCSGPRLCVGFNCCRSARRPLTLRFPRPVILKDAATAHQDLPGMRGRQHFMQPSRSRSTVLSTADTRSVTRDLLRLTRKAPVWRRCPIRRCCQTNANRSLFSSSLDL